MLPVLMSHSLGIGIYIAPLSKALYIYIAPLSKALYIYIAPLSIHPFTHTFTHTPIGCHARYQPACQEQSGVRCLAQGHFDTPRGGIEPATLQLPDDCSYLLSHVASVRLQAKWPF